MLNLEKRNYKLFYSNLRRGDKRGSHVSERVLSFKPILAIGTSGFKSIIIKNKYTVGYVGNFWVASTHRYIIIKAVQV